MSWLGHDTRGASVLATAKLHIKVQQVVAKVLPAALASACRVTKLDGQRLQLAVPTPAHAAKIRQLGPSMGRALVEQGWNLNTIDVTVQGSLQQINAPKVKPPKEAVPLGATAISAFEDLHGSLHPGPLADAVARLIAHHKPPSA